MLPSEDSSLKILSGDQVLLIKMLASPHSSALCWQSPQRAHLLPPLSLFDLGTNGISAPKIVPQQAIALQPV